MLLTTLMGIMEREIGASPSARSTLAAMVAERSQKESAAQAHPATTEEPRADEGRRKQPARRAR